jgi:hypothetical protein
LPLHGPPLGSKTRVADNGQGGTVRIHDKGGNPSRDYDYGETKDHKGHGSPHRHDWQKGEDGKWTRGKSRPLDPGDPMDELMAASDDIPVDVKVTITTVIVP